MNYLRCFIVLSISTFMLFSGADHVTAQFFNWSQNRDEVFRLAKEQDRFVLLFVGRTNCSISKRTSDILSTNYYLTQGSSSSTAGPLKPLVDTHFIPWYSARDNSLNYELSKVYTTNYDNLVNQGLITSLPFVYVINPNEPGKVVASNWGSRSVDTWQKILTVNLLSDSQLKWHEDEASALKLAKQQNKYVFKLIGKGTSPNSQQLMKQLNTDPLKKLLEDNFIPLYINASEENIDIKTLLGEMKAAGKSFPYIKIIYPQHPDDMLFESWGFQEGTSMENILKAYPVSNEPVLQERIVNVPGNLLQITNQVNKEQIYIFTLTGKQVASIPKNDTTLRIDVSSFPKGVLLVCSSAGWNSKIVIL